jgi:hypothetical protein
VIAGRRRTVREAAVAARRLGVTKDQLVQTVLWGFLYADEPTMNEVADELGPMLDVWT